MRSCRRRWRCLPGRTQDPDQGRPATVPAGRSGGSANLLRPGGRSGGAVQLLQRSCPRASRPAIWSSARSGASTVAELGVAGRPAILVPYPFATDDHQTNNAEAFTQSGGGWVVSQRILTPQLLADRIVALATHPDSLTRAAGCACARTSGCGGRFADLVIEKIGGQGALPSWPRARLRTSRHEGASTLHRDDPFRRHRRHRDERHRGGSAQPPLFRFLEAPTSPTIRMSAGCAGWASL